MTREQDPVLERVKDQLPKEPDAFQRLEDRRASKASRKRATAGVVGLGVAAVLIAGLVWSSSRADGDGDVVKPALDVPLVAGPGEYYYARSAWYGDTDQTPGIDGSGTTEFWAGLDDSGRVVSKGEGPDDQRFDAGEFPGVFLPELSDDPATMLDQLIQRGSEGGASPNPIATTSPGRSQETTSLLRTLQDLLGLGSDVVLTPEQAATVFEAASMIDGVTSDTGVIDPLGRPAIAFQFVIDYNYGAGSDVAWYFDPDTRQFLGEVWTNAKTGEVTGATIVEMAGITGSLEELPAPDARYVTAGAGEPSFLGPQGGA